LYPSPSLLCIRHPPRSTPLPYTTLFRSRLSIQRNPVDQTERTLFLFFRFRNMDRHLRFQPCSIRFQLSGPYKGSHPVHTDRIRQDRKSTRLNSSHVSIS